MKTVKAKALIVIKLIKKKTYKNYFVKKNNLKQRIIFLTKRLLHTKNNK